MPDNMRPNIEQAYIHGKITLADVLTSQSLLMAKLRLPGCILIEKEENRMNKARKDELIKEANEAAAAISGCCDGLDALGFDDDDDEYVSTIESNANKLLKIVKELSEV